MRMALDPVAYIFAQLEVLRRRAVELIEREPEIGNCHRPQFEQRRDPASEVAP